MPISDEEITRRIEEENLIEYATLTNINDGVIAWGLSASSYTVRCGYYFKVGKRVSSPEMRVCKRDTISNALDPKRPNPMFFEDVSLDWDEVLVLHPGEYALCFAIEKINMPRDLTAVVLTPSTYARALVLVNASQFESEWSGFPVIEVANLGLASVLIYPGEGIAHLVFSRIEGKVLTSYVDKKGQYQNQGPSDMLGKVKFSCKK